MALVGEGVLDSPILSVTLEGIPEAELQLEEIRSLPGSDRRGRRQRERSRGSRRAERPRASRIDDEMRGVGSPDSDSRRPVPAGDQHGDDGDS